MADLLLTPEDSSRREHRGDPRKELLLLFLASGAVFAAGPPILLLYLAFFLVQLAGTGLSPLRLLAASRAFLFLLFLFCLAAFIQDRFPRDGLPPGESLLPAAARLCLRLLGLYTAGVLFLRRTGIGEIRRAAAWTVSFIPRLPAQTAGLLISLTFGYAWALRELWDTIRDAQKVRGMEHVRNPVKRLAAPLFPLLLNSILRSRTSADALTVRGLELSAGQEDPDPSGDGEPLTGRRFRQTLFPGNRRNQKPRLFLNAAALFLPLMAQHLLPRLL